MSEFFEKEISSPNLIPPDYSEEEIDEELDETIEVPEDFEEEPVDKDLEEIIEKQDKAKAEPKVIAPMSTPFSSPIQTPSWGTPWGSSNSSPGFTGFGSQQNKPFTGFGTQPSQPSWGSGTGQQKEQINRNKNVIFIPFLDGIVETYNSSGQPGLTPRDIYDITPRFNVWQKIAAFNPQRVYPLIPINLLNNTNGSSGEGWETALSYFCCSLSAFLRLPYNRCQILAQSMNGQPIEDVIGAVLDNRNTKITREESVYIGIYSGTNSFSNMDIRAAEVCKIDYIDLGVLLNSMF